jgi:hypothetical protein
MKRWTIQNNLIFKRSRVLAQEMQFLFQYLRCVDIFHSKLDRLTNQTNNKPKNQLTNRPSNTPTSQATNEVINFLH